MKRQAASTVVAMYYASNMPLLPELGWYSGLVFYKHGAPMELSGGPITPKTRKKLPHRHRLPGP